MMIYSGNYSLPKRICQDTGIDNQIGLLLSYPYLPPKNCKYKFVIDNKKYTCWKRNIEWNPIEFTKVLKKIKLNFQEPEWVVVPDAPTNAEETTKLWKQWSPIIKEWGFRTAFAVQNGHTPLSVPKDADVVFIGGDRRWKRNNIKLFTDNFPRVHVAIINGLSWLWVCHNISVESIDGNSYFRKKFGSSSNYRSAYRELIDYIEVANNNKHIEDGFLFPISSLIQTSLNKDSVSS